MKRITKSKGIGIAAILVVALLAAMGLGYAGDVQPLSTQTIDITTKTVTLHHSPDIDDTGEIYVKYSTDVAGDVDVTTGTQVVIVNGQANAWTATPYSWSGKPYAADSLRIIIYDDDLLLDDKLYDQCHNLSTGYNLIDCGIVTTEVIVHNP